MTPLAPLYLLAALAVAGPILFHLWRRTPRGRREFSTLMFLSPSPPRVTSRSRIEHWLLLLLRGAALCFLALAFARPLWRTAVTGPDKPTANELVAVLVDTSASMKRAGAWDDLLKQVDRQIAQLPTTATIGLFKFDDRWSAVAEFAELKQLEPEARRELVKARLLELRPTWGGTNLGEALVRTASALQETQTDHSIPVKLRILLATDLQTGSKLDGLNGFEWPSDLRLQILTAHPKSSSNAGLQWVERNLDVPEDVLRARVSNASDSRREQFKLKWNGTDSAEQSVYVPPGQSRVVVPPKRPHDASSLVLSGDEDDFDNTLYIAPAREETRLVVFCGDDKPDDIAGLRFYLEGVYGASQRFKIQLVGWKDALVAAKSDRPALVVLAEPDPDAADFVKSFLAQGGTVLVAAKTAESGKTSLQQCGLGDLELTEAVVKRDAMLGDIDFEHPIFAQFAESQFSDFTGIRFWKHRHLAGFSAPGESKPHQGHVLARFDDQDPAFIEFPVGRGHVWLLTGAWHPADGQLARSSKFPPLMYRMLEQAAGVTAHSQNLSVGSPIPWQAQASDDTKGEVRVPDGSVVKDVATNVPFVATISPGLYTLDAGGKSEVAAINLAPDESRTSPLPIEQLEALGVKLGAVETAEQVRRAKERERQLQVEELEQSQKLWRWGIMIVIALLLLETWLGGRRVAADSSNSVASP